MATSSFPTRQYTAENFVESAGAIIFKTSSRQIGLLRTGADAVLLAKGRRNIGESRQAAALREATEESGYTCHLLPVTMTSRSPPAVEVGSYRDVPRVHHSVCEPFMVTHREIEENHIKIIWWYIAAVKESVLPIKAEANLTTQFFGFDEAVEALTFESDRDVVRKAIEIFNQTFKI